MIHIMHANKPANSTCVGNINCEGETTLSHAPWYSV